MDVYHHLSLEIPPHLYEPIDEENIKQLGITEPLGFIKPTLDGKITHFYEWDQAGYCNACGVSGPLHPSQLMIKDIYYGFDLSHFYLRIDFNLAPQFTELQFTIDFFRPQRRQAKLRWEKGEVFVSLLSLDGHQWKVIPHSIEAKAKKIIELKIPFTDLAVNPKEEVHFILNLKKDDLELERCPAYSVIKFVAPSSDFEAIQWTA